MIFIIIIYSKSFVIGQHTSDNSRYLEAVALFQLPTPSACDNTSLDRNLVQKVLLHAVFTKSRRGQLFAKKRAKIPYNGFEPIN
jgi:hypothetical protein